METLYLNNYRGFKNIFIPLKKVNFLVGENSTGKTSVLQILNLITSNNFGFNGNFNTREVELGTFKDILNHFTDEKTFKIGFSQKFYNKETKKDLVHYTWMEFANVNNTPLLSKIKVLSNKTTIALTLSYKNDKFTAYHKVITNDESKFEDWINQACDIEQSDDNKHQLPKILATPTHIRLLLIGKLLHDANSEIGVDFFHNGEAFTSFSPIRAKPRRIYELFDSKFAPDGKHTPLLIKQLLNDGKKISRINSFGKESKLYDGLEIENYGDNNESIFGINLIYDGKKAKITYVGYGVSQILPLITEIVYSKEETFIFQQPEVHLHPRAQSAFGKFLFESVDKDKNSFLVETHSDFTIDKFRYSIYEKNKSKANAKEKEYSAQVLFFERTEDGCKITPLVIGNDGNFKGQIPESYRDFFIDEELKMLKL